MTQHKQSLHEFLDRSFARFRKLPAGQVESACERVLDRLRKEGDGASNVSQIGFHSVRPNWSLRGLVTVAAAAGLVLIVLLQIPNINFFARRNDARGTVETADGSLSRISGDKVQVVHVGDRIELGETLRSNDVGGVILLADTSRVEMRRDSELWQERARDGVTIHLTRGGIIVSAAKQRTGHLYVQTRDVMVSVVGTVFFVNAEEEGSRVAVIQGEVHVQHNGTSKNLLPGEQVASNPLMKPQPVKDEISWSRNLETYIALLQQSAVPIRTASQNTAVPRETFDVASIKARVVTGGGGREGGGGVSPACYGSLRMDPKRFSITKASVYQLITLAYGKSCEFWEQMSESDSLSGGPGWIRSDQFDIEANIPDGPVEYVATQRGNISVVEDVGPRVRRMLQSLLEDRFKLSLRRATKDISAYELRLAKGGLKLTPWKDGDPATIDDFYAYLARTGKLSSIADFLGLNAAEFSDRWARGLITERQMAQAEQGQRTISGAKKSMAELATALARQGGSPFAGTQRPVLDRTGIAGQFNYRFQFVPEGSNATGPSLSAVLEKELGLQLVPSKTPAEVLVIDHVERPSEN